MSESLTAFMACHVRQLANNPVVGLDERLIAGLMAGSGDPKEDIQALAVALRDWALAYAAKAAQ